MYSPGTIKAIGLMSKGVSADRAFAQADQIDLQAAQTRVNFYTEQSLNYPSGYMAPSTSVVPSPSPNIPAPATNAQTPAKTSAPSPSTQVVKTFDDMLKQGYKRNTGDGEYLNLPKVLTPGAPGEIAVPSTKKVKPFFDRKFIATPQEELDNEINKQNHPFKNLSPELYKQIPALSTMQWGITDPNKLIDSASTIIAKELVKNKSKVEVTSARSPEEIAEQAKLEDINYKSLKQSVTALIKPTSIDELIKSKKILESQIEGELQRNSSANDFTESQLNPQRDNALIATSINTRKGDMAVANAVSRAKGEEARLLKLKSIVAQTYKDQVYELASDQIVSNLKQGVLASNNADDFIKSLDSFKNTGGGLAASVGDYSQLIKRANIDQYLNRALTQADVDLGGRKVFNEQALNRFNEKTLLSVGETLGEDRYDETKQHLIEAHISIGQKVVSKIQSDNLNLLKKREDILKATQSPELSESDFKKLEIEIKKIDSQVAINDKLSRKAYEIHDLNSLKSNKDYSNFGVDTFLTNQELAMAESKQYYNSTALKPLLVANKTSQYLLSGAAKIVTGILEGVGGMTGWDGLETFGRYSSNYLTPNDLVNFDVVTSKGQYLTNKEFLASDKEGNTIFQPTALLYSGAEVAPLVLATVYGGGLLSSAGGRIVAASRSSLVANGLMSAKRASDFGRALAATKNYGSAYRTVLSQSANPIVKAMASNVPYSASLGAIIYPQEFARAYKGMYEKGIENARGKAHAIAAVSTAIEMSTELMFSEMKFLDDFAEKGLGISQAAKKYGPKWMGNIDQYRTLYGDIFGKAFTPTTLEKLAVYSANKLGKPAAAARFMLARGVEEGREEVAAELLNYFANNHMGLAAMQGEAPAELDLESLVNSFAGGLVGPPIGVGTQIKQYKENKKYGQYFDIMLNSQFYKNKVTEAVKAGQMKEETAVDVLSKIQELETIEKDYGVRNLKNFQKIKDIKTIDDLMEDPYLQFDYFKNVLKKKSIDERIQTLDTTKYTEEQKNALIAEAEEVSKTIDDYKSRSDFYSQLSTEDKQQILDDNINKKIQLSRMAKTETLEKLGQELEDLTIQSVNQKKSEGFLGSVRGYRDGIDAIRKQREEAEQNAITSGTYNPLVDHLENKAPSTELADIKTQEDLEDALVQALLAPDRGKDLVGFMYNLFDQQLETLEQDKEKVIVAFLESAGKSVVKQDTTTPTEEGTLEVTPEARDSFDMDAAISDLTEEQQDELGEILAELDNQYDDLLERKNAVGDMMSTVLTNVAPKEILNIADPEARDKAQTEWVQSIYENASDSFEALRGAMETDPELTQDVFYDRVSFAEYKEQNKEKLSTVVAKNKKAREDKKKAEQAATTTEEERGTVTSTEISSDTGKPVEVISPELLPGDVTPEFEAGLESLATMPESQIVTTASQVEGELITTQEYNKQRGEILSSLLGEVLASPSLEAAQAKLRAVMEAAGASATEIVDTLALLTKVANNEIVYEEDYTHMFDMLVIKANMDLDNLKFESRVVEVAEVIPPIVAPVEDTRTPEEIERTTVLPNVQLGTLKGKLVEYNGVRGVLQISEGGIVTVETDSVIYELENANPTSSTLDYMIQEVTTDLDSKEDDNIISETEVVLDGVEYLIETDSRGTVVGLRDKRKPQKRITKNKLLIRAEVLRNRLEHQVITEAIEETPELMEAIAEAVQSLPSAQVVENLFNFNMTDNIANAIDKLFEEGNNLNLTEAELLETELWIMDTWYKLDDLAKEYPKDEVYQNALENLLIINKLLYNGKQAKSGRKVTPKKSPQEKETRVAPRKTESQSTSKSAISKESAKPQQLNLFVDQPRLSAEELAERAEQERRDIQEYAARRAMDEQEAMEDEALYTEYMYEKDAFKNLDLPAEGEALAEMRISRDSFLQFSDKANLQGREGRAIIFGYIGKRGEGFGVDQVAQRASNIAGREITTDDIIDFILTYPGGVGGPTSKSTTTFFGRNNPDIDPKYSGIQGLIRQRERESRTAARKASKKKTIETPASPFDADSNVSNALLNSQTSSLETNPVVPTTEEQVSTVANQTQIMSTSGLFIPRDATSPDARHFSIQEKIVKSINEEHRTANTGIVDLFTVIEQVLGESTLQEMETIFNEIQSNPTAERTAELRSQFLGLFPAGFMKQTALEYMFDTQMIKNVSQVDVNQELVRNLNASQAEIYEVNKGRSIPEVLLKDGRRIKKLVVRLSQGKLLLLKQTPLFDAEGKEKLNAEGKPMMQSDWYPYETIADPQSILAFPVMGTEAIGFKDLNTLTFTALDGEGKVQKYNDDGSKTNTGNKALITYLPTSKVKENPTPQQVATNGLRKSVASGNRVNKGVKLTGPTYIEREEVNGVSRNKSYKFEFSTEELTLEEVMLSAAEVKEAEVVTRVVTNKDSQQKSIDALNALVAKAKSIPDPDKKGYIIDNERHERQSNFTKRTLGNASIDAPDLDNPESAESVELMELGAAVGNLLDIVGRDVLGGRTVKSRKEYIAEAEEMASNSKLNNGKGYKLQLTEEQFKSLVSELTEFKKELNRKGYELFTEGLVVYRKFTEAERAATGSIGLAGAMDIVAIDSEGGVHIIDFKNKKFKNAEKFKNSLYISNERYPSNISKWSSQQTTYAVLSEDFDLPVRSINIYAFASQYEVKDGVITIDMLTKASDKVPVLVQNKSDISDSVIKLTYDRRVMKQLEIRTVNPKAVNPVEVTTEDINTIKENNQDFTDSEAKNAYLILSSLNRVSDKTKDLDIQDQQPGTQNPADC